MDLGRLSLYCRSIGLRALRGAEGRSPLERNRRDYYAHREGLLR